ncbi:unnamed protein product, partial [Closterium sp. NIES-53]
MWTTNKVLCKRNMHAARAGGAHELAIEGTPSAEIAELGHWALDKMTRAYITAIPVGVVMWKADYSGCKQDYFLGRSRVEPSDKLLDIIAEHIFPGVDALLCDTLKYERGRFAVEKIDLQEEIEKRDDTIATLTAEITRLTEALRVSDAQRMPAAPPSGNKQAPSESGSADSASTGAGAKKWDEKPPKPPQTVNEARYELIVVQPWWEAKTVGDAWRLWNFATANDTRRLCNRVAEPGFVDRHTLLKGATQGAHDMKVRHMLKAMDAVHLLRSSDGDADTEAVVAALNKTAAPGIGTFCDALTVLKPGTALTKSKEPSMGVKGLGPKSHGCEGAGPQVGLEASSCLCAGGGQIEAERLGADEDDGGNEDDEGNEDDGGNGDEVNGDDEANGDDEGDGDNEANGDDEGNEDDEANGDDEGSEDDDDGGNEDDKGNEDDVGNEDDGGNGDHGG